MKKLYIIALVTLSAAVIQCSYSEEDVMRRATRTRQQKNEYFQSKTGPKETPEFRFAQKLALYLKTYMRDLLSFENGDMSQAQFDEKQALYNRTIGLKIANYFENDPSTIIGQSFIDEYLAMPLDELLEHVGTKDPDGTLHDGAQQMQRYVDEN